MVGTQEQQSNCDNNPSTQAQQENLRYWLALAKTPRVGPRTAIDILRYFKTPANFFCAPEREIAQLKFHEQIVSYRRKPDWQKIDQDCYWLEQASNRYILTLNCAAYPPLLKQLPDPPTVLYVEGQLERLSQAQLAIVGARRASSEGVALAKFFAAELAHVGIGVTSGMALGIDGASHEGALAGQGWTIAVLGSGLDKIYPKRHHWLASQIIAKGALVSELPPGSPPLPQNFPKRNRIIVGLGLGVLVVEAATKSGSLISARLALEYNREVFAIPGSIRNKMVKGCHALIKEGAKLVESLADILQELPAFDQVESGGLTQVAAPVAMQKSPASDSQQALLTHVDYTTTPLDLVVERSASAAAEVGATLLMLELAGQVKKVPGGYIRL